MGAHDLVVSVDEDFLQCRDDGLHWLNVEVGVPEAFKVEHPDILIHIWRHMTIQVIFEEHYILVLLNSGKIAKLPVSTSSVHNRSTISVSPYKRVRSMAEVINFLSRDSITA